MLNTPSYRNRIISKEEKEKQVLQRLEEYKIRKKNDPARCKAMDMVVRQHLGYENVAVVVEAEQDYIPVWQKKGGATTAT